MVKTGKAYEDGLLTDWSAPPPNFVLKSIMSVVGALRGMLAKLNPPAVAVMDQCASFIPASCLMMTAKLGIADLLKDGPLTAAELGAKAGVREDDLYRALRMLSMNGYYEALPGTGGQPTRFRNNAASATLREDHPNSVKYLAMHLYNDAYPSFAPANFEWHMRQTGVAGDELPCLFAHAHGDRDYWEVAKAEPEREAVFSKAMANVDALGLEAQLLDYSWARFQRMIDIGGANGSVLSGVLSCNPKMQGVLFDQPQVIESAKKIWSERPALSAVVDRVTFVGGDFFKSETLPELQDGDLVYMRNIIHDWTDESSVRIFKSLRAAIGSAKVVLALCEFALAPEFSPSPMHAVRYVVDINMIAMTGGRERTPAQWEALFAASGFKLARVVPTRSPQSVIEAVPV